jgi:hypothetical protein
MQDPSIDDLELELRRLPGVMAAAIDDDGILRVQLHVRDPHSDPSLTDRATRIAMRYSEKSVAVEVNHWRDIAALSTTTSADTATASGTLGGGRVSSSGEPPRLDLVEFEPRVAFRATDEDPVDETTAADTATEASDAAPTVPEYVTEPAPTANEIIDVVAAEAAERETQQVVAREPRVRLLAVLTFPDTDELEVHLTFNGQRSIGRAPASKGVLGAAEATLDALKVFVSDLDQTAAWARPMEHQDTANAYLVATELQADDTHTLHGIATGTSPIEAAARSTLHALNRTIAPTLAASLN